MEHVSRIRRARIFYRRRAAVARVIDIMTEPPARWLGWCGHAPKHHWSQLFAQLWFIDCPCCLFYRGVTFGLALAGAIVALGALVLGA